MKKNTILRFWNFLDRKKKSKVVFLSILTTITSVAELGSIGSVLPFLTALAQPELLLKNEFLRPIFLKFNILNDDLTAIFSIIFISFIFLSAFLRTVLLGFNTRFTFNLSANVSVEVFRKLLRQPYERQIEKNSSEVLSNITYKIDLLSNTIFVFFTSFNSFFVVALTLLTILFYANYIALGIGLIFVLIYILLVFSIKRSLSKYAKILARKNEDILKLIQEGLGAVRDVIIDGTQEFYCKLYTLNEKPLRLAKGNLMLLGSIPKIVLETLSIVLLSSVGLFFIGSGQKNILDVLPFLGLAALGAQKILPILQTGYSGYIALKAQKEVVSDILDILELPETENIYVEQGAIGIDFNHKISLTNVSFAYRLASEIIVLKNINLNIRKGEKVGIIGQTGEGKSTLLDIIMGLLIPTSGSLIIDDKSVIKGNEQHWQKQVAHVPQNIFLQDVSIAENIAFGIVKDEIDFEKIREAARNAQISDFIENLPKGYDTIVGERGARLSGGQRQRIGIARALYKKASLLIFDEATSALDDSTEAQVIGAIEGLHTSLTIIIVAHRLTSLKHCDVIYEIKKGALEKV